MQNLKAWKFTESATEAPTLEIKNPKEFLKTKYLSRDSFGLDNLQRDGLYKLQGWNYDFKPYLRQFLVLQYGQWRQYYAPNKTTLKASIYGNIDKIQELAS
jgi:hypothetical protein